MKTQDTLDKALKNLHTVKFEYDGFERIVEPYHYGIFGKDRHLHCYQINGGSKTGNVPGWKNFKIDTIKNIKINDELFSPRDAYNASGSKYKDIMNSIDYGKGIKFTR